MRLQPYKFDKYGKLIPLTNKEIKNLTEETVMDCIFLADDIREFEKIIEEENKLLKEAIHE